MISEATLFQISSSRPLALIKHGGSALETWQEAGKVRVGTGGIRAYPHTTEKRFASVVSVTEVECAGELPQSGFCIALALERSQECTHGCFTEDAAESGSLFVRVGTFP